MNTVAPIASLSDAMAKSVNEKGESELDIKSGLETISDSSRNLIDFVQTYRQLSGVAKPVRKALKLDDFMDGVLALNREFASSCGAVCTYRPEEADLMIYADEGQISQIMINLIKNALQAGARHVDITARMTRSSSVSLMTVSRYPYRPRNRSSFRSSPRRRKGPASACRFPARSCGITTAASNSSGAMPGRPFLNCGSGSLRRRKL